MIEFLHPTGSGRARIGRRPDPVRRGEPEDPWTPLHAAVGETPRWYLQTIRIETAKRQLEMANDPVGQIRLRAGYQDATAFRLALVSEGRT